MKPFFFSFLLVSLIAGSALAESSNQQVAARSRGFELVGAFANDGYKIRDSHWFGKLEKGKDLFIEVNLYVGNSYWFALASDTDTTKLGVTAFDEAGNELEANLFAENGRAAVGITPSFSGPCYIRLQLLEGSSSDVCLLYCYK